MVPLFGGWAHRFNEFESGLEALRDYVRELVESQKKTELSL